MSNLKKLLKLERWVENAHKYIGTKKNMEILGDSVVKEIQKNVRLGYGVGTDGGPRGKLTPLSKGYKKQRRKTQLDPTTSANKSNLTRTGEMLRSIKSKFVKMGRALIFFKGMHRSAKVANAALAALHDRGVGKMPKRPFSRLTRTGEKKINKETEKLITSQVKKELTKILGG